MIHEYSEDCLFCKIIKCEIPSYTIYEDGNVKVFLDISQNTPGHTLVVPKTHVNDIFSYNTDLSVAVFAKIPMIARAIRDAIPDITGMNIVNNNGKVAYQSIFHSHIHILPRYTDQDDFKILFKDNSSNYNDTEYANIQARILAALK